MHARVTAAEDVVNVRHDAEADALVPHVVSDARHSELGRQRPRAVDRGVHALGACSNLLLRKTRADVVARVAYCWRAHEA